MTLKTVCCLKFFKVSLLFLKLCVSWDVCGSVFPGKAESSWLNGNGDFPPEESWGGWEGATGNWKSVPWARSVIRTFIHVHPVYARARLGCVITGEGCPLTSSQQNQDSLILLDLIPSLWKGAFCHIITYFRMELTYMFQIGKFWKNLSPF